MDRVRQSARDGRFLPSALTSRRSVNSREHGRHTLRPRGKKRFCESSLPSLLVPLTRSERCESIGLCLPCSERSHVKQAKNLKQGSVPRVTPCQHPKLVKVVKLAPKTVIWIPFGQRPW